MWPDCWLYIGMGSHCDVTYSHEQTFYCTQILIFLIPKTLYIFTKNNAHKINSKKNTTQKTDSNLTVWMCE